MNLEVFFPNFVLSISFQCNLKVVAIYLIVSLVSLKDFQFLFCPFSFNVILSCCDKPNVSLVNLEGFSPIHFLSIFI
jgi:hypothetical protein